MPNISAATRIAPSVTRTDIGPVTDLRSLVPVVAVVVGVTGAATGGVAAAVAAVGGASATGAAVGTSVWPVGAVAAWSATGVSGAASTGSAGVSGETGGSGVTGSWGVSSLTVSSSRLIGTRTTVPGPRFLRRAPPEKVLTSRSGSEGVGVGLAGADAHGPADLSDPDLAVADLPGAG